MLKSRKHVFWEAFLVAVAIFVGGLLVGVLLENQRVGKIENYYSQSEIALMDILVMSNLVELNNFNCTVLAKSNLDFADRIYSEARIMESYADAGKLNEEAFLIAHKRYDLLRSFLWVNSQRVYEKCPDSSFSSFVYLYEYKTEDIHQKAVQNVWSKVLLDLKMDYGDEIVLIPIAVDNDLISLQSLTSKFQISEFPVVIINNEFVVREISSVETLETYL
jgi:hypothetical protein